MAPAYKLTTWTEMGYYYSTVAQGLITDDLSVGDLATFKAWVENYATEQVLLYLSTRYDNDALGLYQSDIVRMWATILGVYEVSRRRGNPALFQGARDEAIGLMKQVQQGELTLPDVPTNKNDIPSMSNYSVDPRFLVNPVRQSWDNVDYNSTANDKPRYPQFPVQ